MFQGKLKIGARCNGVMLALVSVLLLGPVVCWAQTTAPQKQEVDKKSRPTLQDLRDKYPATTSLSDNDLIAYAAKVYGTTPEIFKQYI